MTVVVPYVGGPLEHWDGAEQHADEYEEHELVEGEVFDFNPSLVSAYGDDVIERYVLTRTPSGWVYQYEGRRERTLAPGEALRTPVRDVSTRVVDGPSAGGLVVIVRMDEANPGRYNTLEYKTTRFGSNADGYVLTRTHEGWCWRWDSAAAGVNRRREIQAVMMRAALAWGASHAEIAEAIGSTEDRVRGLLDAVG
jgi:hypothetical protein